MHRISGNEENGVVDAINEAIQVGKEANVPVQISHFKVSGRASWGKSNITLGLIKAARNEGWDVTIDQYPYTASSTNLGVRLPDWALAGGQDSLKARLRNPTIRAAIKKGMLEQLAKYKYKNYSYAVVASYAADSSYNGKSITAINQLLGRRPKASLGSRDHHGYDGERRRANGVSWHERRGCEVYHAISFLYGGRRCRCAQPWKRNATPQGLWHQCQGIGKICARPAGDPAGRSHPQDDFPRRTEISID